jgi:hypothetical protein
MAACNFTINISGAAPDFIQDIKTKVIKQGGTFNGDDASGSFSVPLLGSTVSGSYQVDGQQMAIAIDHKPFFVSCSQIQNYLESNA